MIADYARRKPFLPHKGKQVQPGQFQTAFARDGGTGRGPNHPVNSTMDRDSIPVASEASQGVEAGAPEAEKVQTAKEFVAEFVEAHTDVGRQWADYMAERIIEETLSIFRRR